MLSPFKANEKRVTALILGSHLPYASLDEVEPFRKGRQT